MIFFILTASWTDLENSGKSAINASAILDTGFRLAFSPLPITPFAPAFPASERLGTRQVRLDLASHADVLRLVTRSSPKNVCVRGYNRLDEAVVVVGRRQLVSVTNISLR